MTTCTQEWMVWHPRSKEEADAQRRCLKYLLHITNFEVRLKEIPIEQRMARLVVEEQAIGREQVRNEAEALLGYIEENWP